LPILRAAIPPWRDPYNILFGSGYAGLGSLHSGEIQIGQHGTVLKKVAVQFKALVQVVPEVTLARVFQVPVQVRTIGGVGAHLSDRFLRIPGTSLIS